MAEKTQANPDKLKVLNAVMEKIEKDFGKGSIMRMNSTEVNDSPVIPTGSITLDMALGVGGGILLKGYHIPEITLTNLHPSNTPIWPIMFVSVACGAISGFHASRH